MFLYSNLVLDAKFSILIFHFNVGRQIFYSFLRKLKSTCIFKTIIEECQDTNPRFLRDLNFFQRLSETKCELLKQDFFRGVTDLLIWSS